MNASPSGAHTRNALPSAAAAMLGLTPRALVAGALLAALAFALIASGCAQARRGATSPRPSATNDSTPSAEPTASGEPVALEKVAIELSPLARELDAPLFLTHAGDGSGRLFVVEQGGRVVVIDGGKVAGDPFLDVSDKITSGGERGLLGLAFAPDYETSGRFYVDYTDTNGDTIVARFTADDPASNAPALKGPEVVLRVKQPYSNHNGGCIMFGPDGYLYIGMGDGGSAGDPHGNAHNKTRLLGKMLRIDVDPSKAREGKRYAIPEDNPYAVSGTADGKHAAPEVWMSGLRNPWRYSFDRETKSMWIADVGQNKVEEIDVAAPGAGGQDWGWNYYEGTSPYREGAEALADTFEMPVAEYTHSEGESITGGYVYRGDRYPGLRGLYLFADYVDGWVAGMRAENASGSAPGKAPTRVLLQDVGSPASFGEDESGELYLVDLQGTVSRIAMPR